MRYLENTQALQGWLNRLSVKIMTNLFRHGKKTRFIKSMKTSQVREYLGNKARVLNTVGTSHERSKIYVGPLRNTAQALNTRVRRS